MRTAMPRNEFAHLVNRINDELGREAFSPCYEVFLYGTAERQAFGTSILAGISWLEASYPGTLKWYKTNTMKLPKQLGASARDVASNYVDSIELKPPKLAGIQFHSGAENENYAAPSIEFFSFEIT